MNKNRKRRITYKSNLVKKKCYGGPWDGKILSINAYTHTVSLIFNTPSHQESGYYELTRYGLIWIPVLIINNRIIDEWEPIISAPHNATEIKVMMPDGTIHEKAHWAMDLSGENQPPFRGWFISNKSGKGFMQIETPLKWKKILN